MNDVESGHVQRALAVLGQLRRELESAHGLGDERRTRVLAEVDDIREWLRGTPDVRQEPARGGLEQLALEFESSHPAAAEQLNRLTTLLAGMGI
jgi:hypothetical protein